MKTKDIPALVMLSGGALSCAISLLKKVSFLQMCIYLLITLIIFFFIGCIFRYLIEKHLDNVLNPPEEISEEEEAAEGEDVGDEDTEDGENESEQEGSEGSTIFSDDET